MRWIDNHKMALATAVTNTKALKKKKILGVEFFGLVPQHIVLKLNVVFTSKVNVQTNGI